MDIGLNELNRLLDAEVDGLDSSARNQWQKYRTTPMRIDSNHVPDWNDPLWIVARHHSQILAYNEVEEEFGTGKIDVNGIVRDFGLYGERLQFSLLHFPEEDKAPTHD
jgi:hypothetical protein